MSHLPFLWRDAKNQPPYQEFPDARECREDVELAVNAKIQRMTAPIAKGTIKNIAGLSIFWTSWPYNHPYICLWTRINSSFLPIFALSTDGQRGNQRRRRNLSRRVLFRKFRSTRQTTERRWQPRRCTNSHASQMTNKDCRCVHPSVHLSVCLFICPSVRPSSIHPLVALLTYTLYYGYMALANGIRLRSDNLIWILL